MANINSTYKYDIQNYEPEPEQKRDADRLIEVCRNHLEHVDEEMVRKAFALCYLSHQGIKRASGEPYYYHPVAVAEIVASEITIDDVSVVGSLLHDTVEDTEVTLKNIEDLFGEDVAHIIDGVTKISGVFKSRNTKQAETFMKLLLSMAEDIRVVLIKFADRLHNMRTIQHLPREKQLQIATETLELYAPLAHRFGLFNIKNELEDLCFKVIDRNSFQFISRKLKEKKQDREAFIESFMEPVRKELSEQGFTFEIKGRPKHIYSIFRKMQRQQKPFEEIYDLFAIRIILEDPHAKEDCWRVYSIITDWYTPIPKRFRDFISVPKANGYQSLHTTVITKQGRKVEVQIRTRQMDEVAEKGVAAHWKYKEKENKDGSETLDKFVTWVRDVLDNPRPEAATEFVKDFQLNLYHDEIYVFTPQGELRTLPQGATPIDFAFDIHSEIGERAIAAKVNGKMTPLREKLDIGDQVEIITGNKINLNPDWIDDVVTHKAKSRIRQFIKQKERQVADEGRAIWEKQAKKRGIEISEQELTKVLQKLDFSSSQQLFYEIGKGRADVKKVIETVAEFKSKGRVEVETPEEPKPLTEKEIQETYINAARSISDDDALIINGELTNVKYSYANCCNPIPGDDVIGFISRIGDVKIHRSNCKNVRHLIQTDGERIVDVSWAKNIGSQFLGAVKVIGEDRVAMINDLTDVLSKSLKTNMKSINVNSDSGMFEGILTVFVDDINHLDRIMEKLHNVKGVKSVYRYE